MASWPSLALTTLAPGTVSNKEVTRLLKERYGGRLDFGNSWSDQRTLPGDDSDDSVPVAVTRRICADSGADKPGPRSIAICTSFEEAGHVTPGIVDLWLLLDARKSSERARVGASERDIESGGSGIPGDVGFIDVGPGRKAFAVFSGYTNMGWTTERQTLYLAENDHFEQLFYISTVRDNGGACDAKEDRQCMKRSVSLECTLRVDTKQYDLGFYGLIVDVKGKRSGKSIKRSISIPHVSGTYVVPKQTLVRDGCDEDV